jgi:hypothetical protein
MNYSDLGEYKASEKKSESEGREPSPSVGQSVATMNKAPMGIRSTKGHPLSGEVHGVPSLGRLNY